MAVSICAALDRFTGRAAARWTGFTSAATRRPSSSTSPQACRITIRRRSAARRPLKLIPGGERPHRDHVNLDELERRLVVFTPASRGNRPSTIGRVQGPIDNKKSGGE